MGQPTRFRRSCAWAAWLLPASAPRDAIRLVLATHPGGEFAAVETNKYQRHGASPRAAQALILASKVRALIEGRYIISFEDVRRVYLPALRHRILLNFEAQAENVQPDAVLQLVDEPGALPDDGLEGSSDLKAAQWP